MLKENFVGFLESSIKANWEKEALADYKGKSFLYKDVAGHITRIHMGFELAGIKRGDKISLLGKNSASWGIVFLATVSYGAVIVPILPDFTPESIHHIVNHSDSVIFFTGEENYSSLNIKKMPQLKYVFSLTDFSLLFSQDSVQSKLDEKIKQLFEKKFPKGLQQEDFKTGKVENSELAEISYTSGTTGFSKGVMITHNSLIANIRYAHENMPLKPGDKIVSFLPLAHSYGCAFEFLFPFTLGCHISILGKIPSPQILIQAFAEIKPRLILSAPLVIEKIYKKQLLPVISKPVMKVLLKVPLLNILLHKKIKTKLFNVFGGNFHEIVIGGAAFNKDAELFLKTIKFPFSIGYGMTECGPLISYANWDKAKLKSAGKIVDTLEIKIDSSDPYNEVGEIMVKGENVMIGYYKNEEATKAVLDEEGWLHTGDLGVIDKENYVYIRGRSKDMLLGSSGQNIYPEEIEAQINNMPFVQESVVVMKDNKIVALVYPDPDLVKKEQLSDEKLSTIFKQHKHSLNKLIPKYMSVSEFIIQKEEFEKTPKKSIKRYLYA
ncbi:MAG: AMP-binding protein [Bacteroidales bacterium]|nr:AMP-binding protein [Bacteroidales bacterium]MCF8389613.1 AMP-binding protein [Bacteroidales bacterium]